jgi:hypothetical protein
MLAKVSAAGSTPAYGLKGISHLPPREFFSEDF